MSSSKLTSLSVSVSLILFVLLTLFSSFNCFEPITTLNSNESSDLDEIEELIALDEQEEEESHIVEERIHAKASEAEVLSNAQRIVLELTSDNAKRIVENNEFALVLGYAPWCGRSAELMPQFAKAANLLTELKSPLFMAKIDGDRHQKASSILGIKGFPTLIFFINGSSHAYTGGFTAEEIVIWARKKTGVPVIKLSKISEGEEYLKHASTFVVSFFEKNEGSDYQEFVKAASSDNELQFIEVSDIEVAKVLFPDVKPNNHFLGLVKSEPERYATYDGSFEVQKILEFLAYNKFPLVTILTELNSVRVYSSPIKLQVVVIAKVDNVHKFLEPFQDVARKFKTKVMFIFIDISDENLAMPYLSLFGLEESTETVVAAFDTTVGSKYMLESDPTPRNVEEFSFGLLQSTLLPYFKSQPIPNNKNSSIETIVGKTFDELVLGSRKNVVLEVHTPWCVDCEATSKQIEKLAKYFKGTDNLVFARIDVSLNEHPKLQVNDYPALLFYPEDNKLKPIKLSSKYSSKELAAIIKKNLKSQDQPGKDEL